MRTAAILFTLVILLSPARADYSITWSTVDAGGGTASGGPYELTGTTGQPDPEYSAAGRFQLLGGFWVQGTFCVVNFDDFARFAQYWRQSAAGLPADLYEDGTIDDLDLQLFVEQWLCTCPPDWPLD